MANTLHDMMLVAWILMTHGILALMGLILVVTGVGFVVMVLKDGPTRRAYVALLRERWRLP